MNRSAEQTNRLSTALRFKRFVLRSIPNEPRKKFTHSLIGLLSSSEGYSHITDIIFLWGLGSKCACVGHRNDLYFCPVKMYELNLFLLV